MRRQPLFPIDPVQDSPDRRAIRRAGADMMRGDDSLRIDQDTPPRWERSPSDFFIFCPFMISFRYAHQVFGPQMSQKEAESIP